MTARNRNGIQALLRSASQLREQKRFAEAAIKYELALNEAPGNATAWYNLGLCLRMTGAYERALECYQRAIQCGLPGPEEAHLNRAVIYADALRRDVEAERELARALEVNAAYVPALLNLANLREDYGRRAEAGELYRRAIRSDPFCWEALARSANILDDDADLAGASLQLQGALNRPGVSPADRASLGFALGRVLDRMADYDRAFTAYREANAESRRAYSTHYDRVATTHDGERVMRAFPSAQALGKGDGKWSPIFICGMFRSGSTLLEQILAGHPRISPCGELALIPELVQAMRAPFPDAVRGWDSSRFAALGSAYRRRVEALFPGADLITDKWLGNIRHVGLIKRMFPSAKIVHTVRNPLDNILSIYFLHLNASFGYACDLEDIAHELRLTHQFMAHWKFLYPNDVIEFDYDAFVAQPVDVARNLVAQLGLDWQEECLHFERRDNAVRTASVWQVRRPLYTTSSGRWRRYEPHLRHLKGNFPE